MNTVKPSYPPLKPRHKRIFAAAAIVALLFSIAISLARLELIRWWFEHCGQASKACRWAEFGFNWWWAPLVIGVLVIALLSHVLTADRLRTE